MFLKVQHEIVTRKTQSVKKKIIITFKIKEIDYEQVENNLKEYSSIKNNINKFIYTHSSSGHKKSLEEILSKPEIKKCVEDDVIMEILNETKQK